MAIPSPFSKRLFPKQSRVGKTTFSFFQRCLPALAFLLKPYDLLALLLLFPPNNGAAVFAQRIQSAAPPRIPCGPVGEAC